MDNVPSLTQIKTLELYKKGLSIDAIANERGVRSSRVVSHLAELIEKGQPVDIDRLVKPAIQKELIAVIEEVGDEKLKPIYEYLQERYSYDDIR